MEHFHLDPNISYFDCAGKSILPFEVEKAGHDAVTWKVQPPETSLSQCLLRFFLRHNLGIVH
jgi:hypothetical protein